MEASSNNPTIQEVLTDALRYWEPRHEAIRKGEFECI